MHHTEAERLSHMLRSARTFADIVVDALKRSGEIGYHRERLQTAVASMEDAIKALEAHGRCRIKVREDANAGDVALECASAVGGPVYYAFRVGQAAVVDVFDEESAKALEKRLENDARVVEFKWE